MNVDRDLERQLADFYESEAPPRAPDWVLRSALQTIDTTRQRRVIRVPWRFPNMNTFAKVAVAAVVVIAVGALGLSMLRPPSSTNVGGQPTASPSPSPSPTVRATNTPEPPAALTETYTSERYGFSISYPTGWVTRPATDPWTADFPDFNQTTGDILHDPVLRDNLWIMVASQPLAGKTPTQWLDDLVAGLSGAGECDAPIEPVTIDGGQGRLICGSMAASSAGDRGYLIWLYTGAADPAAVAGYDEAYFNDILATIQLQPDSAVDTPASPSPSS
jgi:hypothetical protein